MKNLIFRGFVLTLIVIGFIQCNKYKIEETDINTAQNEDQLNHEKIIKGFQESVVYFNQQEYKTRNATEANENIQEQYEANLNYINRKTGLALDFEMNEIDVLSSNLIKGSNEFYISDEQALKNIEKIKADGNYELFLEVQSILDEVYEDTPTTRGRFWAYTGCGVALAGNFVATLGLTACATGVGCPVAIAGKVLAYASLVACIGGLAEAS